MRTAFTLILCVVLVVLIVQLTDRQKAYGAKLDAAIEELRNQNSALKYQGEALKLQIDKLRSQLCRAMDEGRCPGDKQ